MGKVSILLPYSGDLSIDQTLQSALKQTYANKEIIVLDMTSSNTLLDGLNDNLKQVRHWHVKQRTVAGALNKGLNVANGEYVTFLFPSNRYDRDKVMQQMSYMLKHHAKLSYTPYFEVNSDKHIEGPFGKRLGQKQLAVALRQSCPIQLDTVMIHKQTLLKRGGFNPTLHAAFDYECWARIIPHIHFYYHNAPLTFINSTLTMNLKQRRDAEYRKVKAWYDQKLVRYILRMSR
ncbi:glycosyltransferase [Caldalkalibacillus salinus]|uniref:glycosyltransferase n=1 Tax=Caldalkalibacillus salinus TaxID=2803787 RepID=UPI00192066E1|nr:glycosyltransferase [Caldalkalibacillus salinus]